MKINGKKVVDANKPLIITVTAKDIANGQRKDPGGCAMALAAKRACHAKSARVHVGRTYIEFEDKWVRYNTSNSLRTELVSFDRGHEFLEGEYRLAPTSPHDRLDSPRMEDKRTHRSSVPHKLRKAKIRYHITSGIRAHGANR